MKRLIVGFGFSLAFVLTVFVYSESRAAENPLIGTWKWDLNKTLQNLRFPSEGSDELKASATKAKKIVEGAAKNLAPNTTVIFADKEYLQIIYDSKGSILSRAYAPYNIITIGQNFVVVDQMENGGLGKLFFEENSFYVEVRVGEYTYKDYFSKISD